MEPLVPLRHEVKSGALDMIRVMLREIRRNIQPLGDLLYEDIGRWPDRNHPVLCVLSYASGRCEIIDNYGRNRSMPVNDVASSEYVHNALVQFLEILDKGILMARDASKLPKLIHCMQMVTMEGSARLVRQYEDQWVMINNNWLDYLELFDEVYPSIFQGDDEILRILTLLINKKPGIFWKQFWVWMSTCCTDFNHVLIHNIAKPLIDSNPNVQMNHCKTALSALLGEAERHQTRWGRDDFADILNKPKMQDALRYLGIELFPQRNLLSAGFQSTKTEREYDGLGGRRNVVLYGSQRD